MNNNSLDILQKRYFREGEKTWEDLCKRVSKGISNAETEESLKEKWFNTFYKMLSNMEFIPSTPCLINADETNTGQLSSCFIIELRDNIESIYQAKSECAKIFQKNGGVGFNISVLRPSGTTVETSKGYSCGCIGFMEEFNLTADVVTRNNMRKGAIKIDLNDWHPDLLNFIKCKEDVSKLNFMNISVSLSDKFMNAVLNDEDWQLIFPDYSWSKEIYNQEWDGDIENWISNNYPVKVYQTLKAKDLYKQIMIQAWKTGEPGVSFRDTMNRSNPNPNLGRVDSTNPCSEFCSIPYNSCNLGSHNLVKYFDSGNKQFDWNKFEANVANSLRFIDNMISVNKLPLSKIETTTKSLRSVGIGVMGFADLLYLLKIPYDDIESLKFAAILFSRMFNSAKYCSEHLAGEKGAYFNWEESKNGVFIRNSNFLSIAPTGSISFIANVSGGIEPNFALAYQRKTNEGDVYYIVNEVFENKIKEEGIYSSALIDKIIENNGSCQGVDEIPKHIQNVFKVASDIAPRDHVKMVSAIQKHVDLSISKTINLSSNSTVADIESIYVYAWQNGIKGITVYRDGCRDNQVLSVAPKKDPAIIKSTCATKNDILSYGYVIQANDDVVGRKRKITTGCGSLHCTAFFDPVDGQLLETYLSKGSTGGCNNFMIGLSRLISLSARAGCDVYTISDQLNSCGACPSYAVRTATKKDTSKGACCPIAIGNALVDMYTEFQQEIGEEGENETSTTIKGKFYRNGKNDTNDFLRCPECNESALIFEGGCNTCKSCGYSKCQ